MLSAVLHTISRRALFAPGERVLVAVSGGPDSMALLAALWELAPRLGLTLEVATVDHGLRREAAAEAELVAERARALGLPWRRLAVDVRAGGARGGIQEAARRARLDALATAATTTGCARVALGHQADDQAETVLFRLLRGTGLAGLAGIPYRRDPFVRPLLDVTRTQIVAYLRRRSIPFATDPSNADARFARARLRHLVLPMLRKENPRVDEALRRLADEAAALPRASGAPTELAQAEASSRAASAPTELARAARAAGVHVSARLAAALAAGARRGGTRSFDGQGGRRLTVSYGRLRVGPPPSAAPEGERKIPGVGTFKLGPSAGVVIRARAAPLELAPFPASSNGDVDDEEARRWSWFDRERLAWPLVLRAWRPGDCMRPRGGRGSRKLSDLFIDAKTPRYERRSHLVVAGADGEILFVGGLRPSQVAAPTAVTRYLVGIAAWPIPRGPSGARERDGAC